MKISSCNPGFTGCRRDISARFPQESQDGLALELPDQSRLAGEKAIIHRELELARLLEMKRQVIRPDRAFGGKDHGALDDVFELTEVAGPGVPVEQVERLGRDALDLLVDLRRGGAQEVVREHRQVLDPLAQG